MYGKFLLDLYSIREEKSRTTIAPVPSPRLNRLNQVATKKEDIKDIPRQINSTPSSIPSQGITVFNQHFILIAKIFRKKILH